MQAYVAEIGEIVRSQRRDEEEIQTIQEKLSKIIKELLGQRQWLKLFPYLSLISQSVYYSSTLLAGSQTLGEEYVRLFETAGLRRIAPSLTSRLLFVLLHVYAPLLTQIGIQKVQKKLNHPSTSSFLGIPLINNPKARRSFQAITEWIRSTGIPQFRRIHLALFYIFGAYYNLARRVTGIRFLSLSPQSNIAALKVYRILGYLTLAQTAVSLSIWAASAIEEERKQTTRRKQTTQGQATNLSGENQEPAEEEVYTHPWFRCSICLESRHPSTAPCGHLFCWSCIQEHALTSDTDPKCPQCRTVFEPSQVVPLLNL